MSISMRGIIIHFDIFENLLKSLPISIEKKERMVYNKHINTKKKETES